MAITMHLSATSPRFWNTSRDGNLLPPQPWQLCHCSTIPSENIFFLISNLTKDLKDTWQVSALIKKLRQKTVNEYECSVPALSFYPSRFLRMAGHSGQIWILFAQKGANIYQQQCLHFP